MVIHNVKPYSGAETIVVFAIRRELKRRSFEPLAELTPEIVDQQIRCYCDLGADLGID